MFAVCIESSHKKGMGHLFRMLNLINYLKNVKVQFTIFINNDFSSSEILKNNNLDYTIVKLEDYHSNWEGRLIKQFGVKYWINDRLNTSLEHANNIKKHNVKLITFDDAGSSSLKNDINICGLYFNNPLIKGKKVLSGSKYLILNNEIKCYRFKRKNLQNVFVSLGGTDTHGVTVQILKLLKNME